MSNIQYGSVLDLPIQRQREIAKRNNMTLEEWQDITKESLKRSKEFTDKLTEGEVTPAVQAFLDRCDSETVGFGSNANNHK